MRMEDELHKRVIGQHAAIEVVLKAIRRSRAGLKDPKRPTGSFIFLGPSGVGKTELARTLAEFLFGDEDAMVRVDMSEYMEKHAVSRLVGSPPGYIGYDEGGQLTEAVRRKPYSVLLLDEIEKAHPDVFNILLQILEDGRLTDAQGRTVDFRNSIVIITAIVELLLKRIRESLAERELSLNLSDSAADFLVEKGWDPAMGARPLRRAIQRYIEDPLADEVLSQSMPPGSTIEVDKAPEEDENDVTISIVKGKERTREAVGVGAKGGPLEEGSEEPDQPSGDGGPDLPDEPEVLPD